MGSFAALRSRTRPYLHTSRALNVARFTIAFLCIMTALTLLPPFFDHSKYVHSRTAISSMREVLALPSDYQLAVHEAELGLCSDRYGLNYLRKFSTSAVNHCDDHSSASLTCFTHQSHNERNDSFCVASPATFRSGSINLHCVLRDWDSDATSQRVRRLHEFPKYWYNTGPRVVIDRFIILLPGRILAKEPGLPTRTLLLVKREDPTGNMWHSLLQIMSLGLSLDILQISSDSNTGMPFLSREEYENSQVVVLDNHDEGPFWQAWGVFSGLPPKRVLDLPDDESAVSKIIVPLPGGSNPLWTGDWEYLPCQQSSLLKTFSRRMLEFYGIAKPLKPDHRTLTFIDRRGTRRLLNITDHFNALEEKFPEIRMQLLDLAAMPFLDQLRVAHSTDILVGVHGAGLTHELFMSPGSSIVEIQPPGLRHKGFDNMANFLDIRYFRLHGQSLEHAEKRENGSHEDWHREDVVVEQAALLELMEKVVARSSFAK